MLCISDWKESPEETLKQVAEAIREFGLILEISDDDSSDQIFWTIRRNSADEAL